MWKCEHSTRASHLSAVTRLALNPISENRSEFEQILLLDQRDAASKNTQGEPSSLRRNEKDQDREHDTGSIKRENASSALKTTKRTQLLGSQHEFATEVVYHSAEDEITNYSGVRLQDNESKLIIDLKSPDDRRVRSRIDDLMVLQEMHQNEPEISVAKSQDAQDGAQRSVKGPKDPKSEVPDFVRSLKSKYGNLIQSQQVDGARFWSSHDEDMQVSLNSKI